MAVATLGGNILSIGGAGGLLNRIDPGFVSVANQSLSEDGGTMTFTIQLSAISSHNISMDYRTKNGTATAGSDYTAVSGSKTITAGQTSTTVDVAILNDGVEEDEEAFTLVINNIRYSS
jgi:hypothetical protein